VWICFWVDLLSSRAMSFTPLVSKRLTLRPLTAADAESLFRYRSHPEVSRYQGWEPTSLGEASRFIAELLGIEPNTPGSWFQLGIFLRHSGVLVGDCGLHFPQGLDHEAEFGISLAPSAQGRGYATEALVAVFELLFSAFGKRRIFASVDPRNTGSIRLLERLGMRREAHFHQSLWFKGEWVDDVIFALLRREWEAG